MSWLKLLLDSQSGGGFDTYMSERLYSSISPFFQPFLQDRGFHKTDELYDPRNFGNELLVFESTGLRIRFVRDRGEVFVDVGPVFEEKWYFLDDVLELLEGRAKLPVTAPADLDDLSKRFEADFSQIESLFIGSNYADTKNKLESLRQIRAKEMFGQKGAGKKLPGSEGGTR